MSEPNRQTTHAPETSVGSATAEAAEGSSRLKLRSNASSSKFHVGSSSDEEVSGRRVGGQHVSLTADATLSAVGASAGEADALSRVPVKQSSLKPEAKLQRETDAARSANTLSPPPLPSSFFAELRNHSAADGESLSRQGSSIRKSRTATGLEKQRSNETDGPSIKVFNSFFR